MLHRLGQMLGNVVRGIWNYGIAGRNRMEESQNGCVEAHDFREDCVLFP